MGQRGTTPERVVMGGMEELESRLFLANSAWAYPSINGTHLIYKPTPLGDRVIDFSGAGYESGGKRIPDVPTVVKVAPGKGDDTQRIQQAIDRVAALPLNKKTGFRGAVYLKAGKYKIGGQIQINVGGIVVRGAGDGAKGTRLLGAGDERRALIEVNKAGGYWTKAGSDTLSRRPIDGRQTSVTDKYVPVGARSFHVADTAGLAVGDRIVIVRPSTQAWLDEIEMSRLHDMAWQPGSKNLEWERTITRIEGSKLTLDDPITTALDARYGGGIVYRTSLAPRIRNVGIEDIRGDSTFDSSDDEDHAEYLVRLQAVENAWVRRVTAEHFVHGLAVVEFGARAITIERAVNLSPVSPIEGGYRYAFNVRHGEKVLVRDSRGVDGRHDYLTGFTATGPIVFVDSVSRRASDDVGPHHRWASGVLFDNIITDDRINVRNRGERGPGHGWAGANVVVWNSIAKGGFIIRNPPTAQNWLIGGRGPLDHRYTPDLPDGAQSLPNAKGTYDAHGQNVDPRSLYHAQVKERAAHPEGEYREYWAGDIDGYVDDGPADDPYVLPKWAKTVGGKAGHVRSFDDVEGDAPMPFSFEFALDTDERVVGASLSIGLRRTGGAEEGGRVLLGRRADSRTLKVLGWDDLGTSADARVIDLNGSLKRLQDGRLNVAVRGALAVDWAILNLHVAPAADAGRKVWRAAPSEGSGGEVGSGANHEAHAEAFSATGVFGERMIVAGDFLGDGDLDDEAEVLGRAAGDLNRFAILR